MMLDVMPRPEVRDMVKAVAAAPDVGAALALLKIYFPVDHITYHMAFAFSEAADAPFVRSTYPAEWLGLYLVRNYVRVDEVVRQGMTTDAPFFWSELQLTPEFVEIVEEASLYGVSGAGYSIPLSDSVGRRGMVSIVARMPEEDLREYLKKTAAIWKTLADVLHDKAMREAYGENDPARVVTTRERQCLYWVAQGKDHRDIAEILQITPHTARSYMKSARQKLGCTTIAQAVAKAMRYNMIART
ncbi:helix-turn-helix transcriptional regulator [Rhizobium paknamense]|uniref:DNA-binding CsgD family transcriptional regulator n=1 Tax=Rhizobium paknamense TaxID=1206817 RepID=A0ABU0IBC1_9HYPH|nr:LuxR family transcriptional regulator [Rhizobium paknamense]MDQ0455521.1 DNA-binding CsgD family transcriptional regulator [Rhizobium paknamense]